MLSNSYSFSYPQFQPIRNCCEQLERVKHCFPQHQRDIEFPTKITMNTTKCICIAVANKGMKIN